MFSKLFARPLPFLALVPVFALCHFGVFAVSYFLYRRSYYLAPSFFQWFCGIVSLILGYPLRVVGGIPFEPNKFLLLVAAMVNSVIYAVALTAVVQLFRRYLGAKR